MNKLKLFLENFLVYGLGGTISKVIPLIMVPVVTRLMPDTSYYGISDMATTLVSLCSSLAVMGMYDAMYRMFFEKGDNVYRKEICSTAFYFTLVTSFIVFIVMIFFRNIIADVFFKNRDYAYLVYITSISTLVGATNSIVSAPTRMQNQRKRYIAMHVLSPLLSYSISVPLLLKGYYIIALPLAGMIAAFSCEMIFAGMNRKWFSAKLFKAEHLKPLLTIGIPLFPNFLIYWLFNSCDRLMITNILGASANGIYAAGSKLGMASQLIYTAFSGGWQYFAFSTMKEKKQVESNSLVFEYLGIISFSCTLFVFAFSEPIYTLLFTGNYREGYIVSPYLFLAPLLQMLFQIIGNQFLVIKKTWPSMFILLAGAVMNVFLNLLFIPRIGIEGAAIATLFGYMISDFICVIVLKKLNLIVISKRFCFSVCILAVFIIIWRTVLIHHTFITFGVSLIISIIYMLLYKKDLYIFMRNMKK